MKAKKKKKREHLKKALYLALYTCAKTTPARVRESYVSHARPVQTRPEVLYCKGPIVSDLAVTINPATNIWRTPI